MNNPEICHGPHGQHEETQKGHTEEQENDIKKVRHIWFLSPSLGDMFGKVKGKLCNFCTILFCPVDVPASWLIFPVVKPGGGDKGKDLINDGTVVWSKGIPFDRVWNNFQKTWGRCFFSDVNIETGLAVVQQEFGELVGDGSGLNFHVTIVVHVGEVVQ